MLYDSGEMSVSGPRSRVTVAKTAKGVEVKTESLYSDQPTAIHFYQDGNYPELPNDWQSTINDRGTTASQWWLHQLGGYTIDRAVNPSARALGRIGGASTSQTKRKTSAENGKKGGRPRKSPK